MTRVSLLGVRDLFLSTSHVVVRVCYASKDTLVSQTNSVSAILHATLQQIQVLKKAKFTCSSFLAKNVCTIFDLLLSSHFQKLMDDLHV